MGQDNYNKLQSYEDVLDRIVVDGPLPTTHTDHDELLENFEKELLEGNVAVDAIAKNVFSGVRRAGQRVRKSKSGGEKLDAIFMQLDKVAALGLLSTIMSGSRKGLLGKGSRLLSIVKSMS